MSFAKLTSMSHVAGYRAANFFYDGFSCIQCTPDNFAKEPNSTKRPLSTTPNTTQKETSPATPETNVLPNATQSYSSPPPISTASFGPWSFIETKFNQTLLKLIQTTYKKTVVNWKPRFIILSKNKPGFQFIELLNQQLLSLVEETPNSNIAMKAAIILPHLLLHKTKLETNGTNSKTLCCRLTLRKQGQ